jgi:hypothetical protein
MDGMCFEEFLGHLGEIYVDHRLVVVLDGAPSHTSKEIELPERERQPPGAALLFSRTESGREMVSGVQADPGQQSFRDHRITARCTDAST